MITVGNDKFPDEAGWLKIAKEVTKPAPTYVSKKYDWESESESDIDPDSDDDYSEKKGAKTDIARAKDDLSRESELDSALKVYMKKEWNRFREALDTSLGELAVSSKMESQLRTQFGYSDDAVQQTVAKRIAQVFPAASGDSGAVAVNAGEYEAQPMPPDVAADKLSSGKFTCMSELAWVIYNAGGYKAGGSYTSADNEKKLTTRPDFSPATETERKAYVDQAKKGLKEVDLRHIISSTTLNKALANSTDTLKDVNVFLKAHSKGEQKDILPAKIEVFKMVHSHLGNLWPGGAADNQAAGTMHGKLNYEARKQAARTKPDASAVALPDPSSKPSPKGPPPIDPGQSVSECRVNSFLTEVAKLDDAIAKKLQRHLVQGDDAVIAQINEHAALASDLNDQIRCKVGTGDGGYTVEAMEADLNDWLVKNPALADGSLKAEILSDLRGLCQKEANSLKDLKTANPLNAHERVDKCELTSHLEKLRARGEISKGEQDFLKKMKTEEGVLKDRQVSQKTMATACVDYLQARSVACDKLKDDANGVKGYTQKDLVGDLENLAANFDFDLAESILPQHKITETSGEYATKLVGVEVALLKAKAENGVALFKRENGQPSVMDQFMALDYKLSEKVVKMVDVGEKEAASESEKVNFKRPHGDERTHDQIREKSDVIPGEHTDDITKSAKKQKLSESDGAEQDPMLIASGTLGTLGTSPPRGLSRSTSVGSIGKFSKCEGSQINSLEDMKKKLLAGKKSEGAELTEGRLFRQYQSKMSFEVLRNDKRSKSPPTHGHGIDSGKLAQHHRPAGRRGGIS